MSNSIGKLSDQAAVRRLQLDDVTFTYIVDGAMSMVPHHFLPSVPAGHWTGSPGTLDANGHIPMSAGGLLVERDGCRVLIDAGLGVIDMDSPLGRGNSGDFLTTMAALGIETSAIDLLAFTHLHGDHTGWAFTTDNEPRPTFPRAAYAVAEAELADHDSPSIIESLRRHPNLTLVHDGKEIAPGITALVTPGHSPGHTSYVVTTPSGKRLIAFGDTFHTPAQLAHIEWSSAPDSNPHAVPAARTRLLIELSEPDTIGFGIHFGDQPFGHVEPNSETPAWHPVRSTVLMPATRTC